MIPDNVYVQRAVEGDDKAFNVLVKRHRPKIYGVAHKMLDNPREAERMTHETFSAAHKHIKAFRGHTGFGTWIYRIFVNQCLKYKDTRARLGVY